MIDLLRIFPPNGQIHNVGIAFTVTELPEIYAGHESGFVLRSSPTVYL